MCVFFFTQQGLAYFTGRGAVVAQDEVRAVSLFERAAGCGNREAQYNLGLAKVLGKGTDKDTDEALRLWRLAADQGLADAQYSVAVHLIANTLTTIDSSDTDTSSSSGYHSDSSEFGVADSSRDALAVSHADDLGPILEFKSFNDAVEAEVRSLLERAAGQGHAKAALKLASLNAFFAATTAEHLDSPSGNHNPGPYSLSRTSSSSRSAFNTPSPDKTLVACSAFTFGNSPSKKETCNSNLIANVNTKALLDHVSFIFLALLAFAVVCLYSSIPFLQSVSAVKTQKT
jgi:hypothetical protein